ncbi:MAG TPA: hypothetical protein VLZ50_03205 [Terracidiphilus sp.]|nr:hypothetical protein [Terracidiphilus sp.]
MNATFLYRVAGSLLFVFAAANASWCFYFLHATASMTPVRFPFGHNGLSYAQIVFGLEVFCSLCVLFAAYLAWHLGALARTTPQAAGMLGWVLLAYQAAGTFVALFYLSGFAFVIAAVAAICTAWANSLAGSAPTTSTSASFTNAR